MTDVAERRKRGQDKASGWGETIRTVVYAVLIAVVVRTFAIEEGVTWGQWHGPATP